MFEYFVVARSNAAPMFSDTSKSYKKGNDPQSVMEEAIKEYKHPCGLYAIGIYESADDYEKGLSPVTSWKSERAIKKG